MSVTVGSRQPGPRPTLDSRRHSTGPIPRQRGPLRSSPLAGPAISPSGPTTIQENQDSSPSRDSRPRAKPSRISSSPDLAALAAANATNAASTGSSTTTSTHSRSATAPPSDGVQTRPTRSKSALGITPPMPAMPAWARSSLSQSSSPTEISPSSSSNSDWLTHAPSPTFSRAGLGAGAVIMPVRAPRSRTNSTTGSGAASIRSVNSVASSSRSISGADGLGMPSGRGRSRSTADTRSIFSLSSRKSFTISLHSPPGSPHEDVEASAGHQFPGVPAAPEAPEAPDTRHTRVKRRTFSFSSIVSLKSSKRKSVAASSVAPVSSGSGTPIIPDIPSMPIMPTVTLTASPEMGLDNLEYETARCMTLEREMAAPRNISRSSLRTLTEPTFALGALTTPYPQFSHSSPDMLSSDPFASDNHVSYSSPNMNMAHSPTPSLTRTSTYGSSLATAASVDNYGTLVPLPSLSPSPLSTPRTEFKLESGHVWSSSADDVRHSRDSRNVRASEYGTTSMSSKGDKGEKKMGLWGRLKRVTMPKRVRAASTAV